LAMKITVEISDELFRRAKKRCAERGISFRKLVERGLRLELDRPKTTGCFRLKPFGFAGEDQQEPDWTALLAGCGKSKLGLGLLNILT
jgi:hypothetical protein